MSKDKSKAPSTDKRGQITGIISPMSLNYSCTAGAASSSFLKHLKEGRIVGQRCEGSTDVYVPPRGSCPKLGRPTTVDVPLSGAGVVEGFTIVHIPIPDNPIKPPFVVANILLDGASTAFIHLISEVKNEEVHIGMRIVPVWRPKEEWTYSMENILYFKPSGGPSVDLDAVRASHRA